jgi:hypothetical protein
VRAIFHISCLSLFLFLSLCCGGGGGGTPIASAGDGISGTGDFSLSKVDLAHENYGSGANNDFTVNTLSPILHLKFDQALPASPETLFQVELTDLGSHQSLLATPGSVALKSLSVVPGKDLREFYIHISKSADLTPSQLELKPGNHYRYVVSPIEGHRLMQNGAELKNITGYLRVKNVTMTYLGDFTNGDTTVIDGGHLQGLKTLEPEFMIHSRYPLSQQLEGDNPLSLMALSLGGVQVLKPFSKPNFISILDSNATSVHIKLTQSPLVWGQSLELKVQPKSVNWSTEEGERAVQSSDMPSKLVLETQQDLGT